MKAAAGRTCLLVNPRAGSAGQLAAIRDRLTAAGVEVRELAPDDDLTELARKAADDGFTTVVVAGGDGTVHAAAAGLIAAAGNATLAVLPLGTGNDFCRTLAIPLDAVEATELLRTGTPRAIDVARIDGGPGGYLVNAATGGFSGMVAAEVTSELKAAWGPLAYLRGAVGPATDLPTYRVTLRLDGGPSERFDVLNVVVANARTAAGGFPVAPAANPEDGLLDVVLVHAGDALDLSVIAGRMMHGDYTHDENVTHRTARTVELESDPPLPMSLDGERCECARVAFTVMPNALRVIAGPGYTAVAGGESPVEAEEEAPPATPDPGVARRLFGFVTAVLLLVKRAPASAAGLGLAAVAVLIFAWLARGVVGAEWQAWNESVMLAQHAAATPALDLVAKSVTRLADPGTTAVLSTGLLLGFLWRKHYLTAATFAGIVAGVVLTQQTLKPLFAQERPALFPHGVEADGYSFPSGHALQGVAVFGFLACLCVGRGWERKRVGWWLLAVGCVALAVLIPWSRVYLGVHWPTDVIAGGLASAAWVAACLVARRYAMTRPGSRR